MTVGWSASQKAEDDLKRAEVDAQHPSSEQLPTSLQASLPERQVWILEFGCCEHSAGLPSVQTMQPLAHALLYVEPGLLCPARYGRSKDAPDEQRRENP